VQPPRESTRSDGRIFSFVAAGTVALLPPVLLHLTSGNQVALTGTVHFWAVGLSAAVATAAGIALSVAGRRRRDARSVLVGTAFTVMAALLFVHGLASPGVIVGMNGVVALTGAATLPVGGAILVLAAVPGVAVARHVDRMLLLQGLLMSGVVVLGVIALAVPSLVPPVPDPNSPPALALLLAGLGFYGVVAWRVGRTVVLARRRTDFIVLAGIVWLAAALVPALTTDYTDLVWWLGHGFEVVGILIVGAPVALDLFRAHPTRPLAGDLGGAELVSQEEAYLGSQVRALTRLLAEKDTYTEEHTRRVALLAVQVGEELGLPAGRLRTLAIGGLLHDVGKLRVPEEILGKPDALTDDEFSVIQRHPGWGDELLRGLGFGRHVRRLVLDHHERLDGSGYPRSIDAAELDLDTRILSVCDVYDALRSTRVYRDAWSHERAIGLLRDESGVRLDARCVAALERVLDRSAAALPEAA
jgi:putative nucleotidyltransferase with HDIG domain